MSIKYTVLEDQLHMLITSISSEPDVLVRLRNIRAIKKTAFELLRQTEREAAYDARLKFSFADIQEIIEIGSKELDYLVRVYLVNNPDKPQPKRRQRADLSKYIDLTGR